MSKNQVIADLAAARAERESRDNGTREIAYGRPGGINDPSKNYDGCEDAAHMLERILFRRNYPAVTLEAVAARLEQIVSREAQKLAHEHVKRMLKAKK